MEIIRALPAVNAGLNAISAVLIILGTIEIRRRNREAHRRLMLLAAITSAVFLVSYLVKTWYLGTTVYGGVGWMRVLYLFILFSHLSLAIVIAPLVPITLVQGLAKRFDRHRRIARWTLPIWLYVSVTGILVFLLLRPYY